MVTTFVTHSNLQQSAANLDNTRVYRQCQEAKMAINYLQLIENLAIMFKLQRPNIDNIIDNFIATIDWAKNVVITYKAYCKTNNIQIVKDPSNNLRWLSNQINKNADEKYILKGYVNHPATLAWTGYLEGLKYYYNIHYYESVKRQFNIDSNTKPYQLLSTNPDLPWWITNPIIQASYKNNLLFKELTRQRTEWYMYKSDFMDVTQTPIFACGNLWLAKLNRDQLQIIAKCNNINEIPVSFMWQVCDIPNYSQKGSPIQITDVEGYPAINGGILYTMYYNSLIPEYFRQIAYYWYYKLTYSKLIVS